MRRRRAVGAAIVMGLAMTASACSSSATSQSDPIGGSAMAGMGGMTTMKGMRGSVMTDAACGILPIDVLNGIYGVIVSAPVARSTRTTTSCVYRIGSANQALTMDLKMEMDRAHFSSARRALESTGIMTTTVPGLGTSSYRYATLQDRTAAGLSDASTTMVTLVVLSNGVEMTLRAPRGVGHLDVVARDTIAHL